MSSRFDQYAALAQRATTGVMGRTATITPRTGGGYGPPVVDPDRAAFAIEGILSLAPKNGRIQGQKTGGEFTGATRLALSSAEFWISAENYTAAATEIRRGDLLAMDDDPGGPGYAVIEARPNDAGDWDIILTREEV